jgi:hypothetical protein
MIRDLPKPADFIIRPELDGGSGRYVASTRWQVTKEWSVTPWTLKHNLIGLKFEVQFTNRQKAKAALSLLAGLAFSALQLSTDGQAYPDSYMRR